MAGMAMAAPPTPARSTFWNAFERLVTSRVRECNALAGEQMWIAAVTPGSALTLIVQSATCPADSVECSFDANRGILTCRPGAQIKGRTCHFRLIDETAGKLRRGSEHFTLDQAMDDILGQLVWAHE